MPLLKAWRPDLPGVAEVLHARFDEHAYPMHAHDTWTVLLVDDGAVRYDLDRHSRGAFGDLVTVLPPRVPHNGVSARPGGFRKRVLYLDEDQLPAALIGASVDTPAISDRTLHAALSRVHRLATDPGDAPLAESLLVSALDRLSTHLSAPTRSPGSPARSPGSPTRSPGSLARSLGATAQSPPSTPAAHALRDLLEAHLVDGLSLSKASVILHFDAAHLVRSFRREFGMSPHQYLISRRVDLARHLIMAGHPLGHTATAAGFHDQPHLTRHFKRILGVTPGLFAR